MSGAFVKELILGTDNRMVFTTDAQGRVTRCEQQIGAGEDVYSYVDLFTYGDNQLIWNSNGVDCTCAMENGRVTIMSMWGQQYTYTYNPDGTLASSNIVAGVDTQTTLFSWTDGNLTRVAEANNNFSRTMEYGEEFSGIGNIDLVYYIVGDLEEWLPGTVSRNLPTSCTVRLGQDADDITTYTYSYEFGANQAVSKIHRSVDGDEEAVFELKY